MPLPPTKYTAPTYPTLEPKARAWAVASGLIHPNGMPKLATVLGQFGKTLEEISEAQLELRKLEKSKALYASIGEWDTPIDPAETLKARRHALALEFGDIIVTLSLLAAMHGVTLGRCLLWPNGAVQNWQFVDKHAAALGDRLEENSVRIPTAIGAVARCVEDQSRIVLEMTGPQCLALALAKIEGSSGAVVDGVFVKSAVTVGA